ncbi:hypothetical protein HYC85_030043 [Camellia sinensis]|uniref:Uncharacterized protein n=1 Tax=Camellia sinensis TaxID=4442 RepID=A0A7J7FZM1_CAMSI|nr:hypothetical protein HYC85_030043 [Camellia sinensis]
MISDFENERRLGKRATMHRLPLFSFLHSSGGCQNLRTASLDTRECHRLSGITIGSGVWPSAQNEAVGRGIVAGRHLTLPVSRVFLQNLQMTATEGKAKHGSTIQGIYAPTMSLIMIMTQRGMCLDSRATNHAFPCTMAQRTNNRGGSSAVPAHKVLTWLDGKVDDSVVYVCFGSHVALTSKQREALAVALECSRVHFIWCVKASDQGHVAGSLSHVELLELNFGIEFRKLEFVGFSNCSNRAQDRTCGAHSRPYGKQGRLTGAFCNKGTCGPHIQNRDRIPKL